MPLNDQNILCCINHPEQELITKETAGVIPSLSKDASGYTLGDKDVTGIKVSYCPSCGYLEFYLLEDN